MEMKSLKTVLSDCKPPYDIKVVDPFNRKIAAVKSKDALERVKDSFGHLNVIREATYQGLTALQVIR